MRKLTPLANPASSVTKGSEDFSVAVNENKRAVDSYIPTGGDKPSLSFPGYNKESFKKEIRQISNGSCGYCGSRVEGGDTVTVEHYRPKAKLNFQINPLDPYIQKNQVKVSGATISCMFGYYQDGDDSNNMLPSCASCNKGNGNSGVYIAVTNQDGVDRGFLDKKISYGKDSFFPLFGVPRVAGSLVDHRYQLLSVDDTSEEVPLLFNPYADDPDDIFDYKKLIVSSSTNHALIKIRPRKGATGLQKIKAQVSINLLGLNRKELCHKRAIKYNNLKRLTGDFSISIGKGDFSLITWVKYAQAFSSEFSKEHSEVVGFGLSGYSWMLPLIRKVIVNKVNSTNLTVFSNSDEVFDMVSELNRFSSLELDSPNNGDLNSDLRSDTEKIVSLAMSDS